MLTAVCQQYAAHSQPSIYISSTHTGCNTPQERASRRRENALGIRVLQPHANPRNTLCLTRNETLGQRFDSARQLSDFPANPVKM